MEILVVGNQGRAACVMVSGDDDKSTLVGVGIIHGSIDSLVELLHLEEKLFSVVGMGGMVDVGTLSHDEEALLVVIQQFQSVIQAVGKIVGITVDDHRIAAFCKQAKDGSVKTGHRIVLFRSLKNLDSGSDSLVKHCSVLPFLIGEIASSASENDIGLEGDKVLFDLAQIAAT